MAIYKYIQTWTEICQISVLISAYEQLFSGQLGSEWRPDTLDFPVISDYLINKSALYVSKTNISDDKNIFV